MKPHPRIRKTIKWGGAAVTLLLVVVWIRSESTADLFIIGERSFRISRGSVMCLYFKGSSHVFRHKATPADPQEVRLLGWHYDSGAEGSIWFGPLWLPLAVALFVTGAACLPDALNRLRRRAGVCPKCSYDRAGIAGDAKCPECGSGGGAAP
jgi:hypothetical protein